MHTTELDNTASVLYTVLLFSKRFVQLVNVRSASIKLVNTGNFYSQSGSTIHSLSSNFIEHHVTVIVKEKYVILLSDFGTCPTTSPFFQIMTAKGM